MCCIGFLKQWPLDHAEVLYTKSESMVCSQKMVSCTLLVRGTRPHSRNHISNLALEGFGVLPAASERMDRHSSESGFPDKMHVPIHLPILLWFSLSQKPFLICKTNDGWCHSVVEWCLFFLIPVPDIVQATYCCPEQSVQLMTFCTGGTVSFKRLKGRFNKCQCRSQFVHKVCMG